jgi:hypothetical protein
MSRPESGSEEPDGADVWLPGYSRENPYEGRLKPFTQQPDGSDGWLTMPDVVLKLRVETAVFKTQFPEAKEVERGWNFVTFERWFLFWGTKSMIFIVPNGRVQYTSYNLKWKDKKKRKHRHKEVD